MLSIINFFLFLIIIHFSIDQDINYELACTNIFFKSKKDCTVAPWHDNYRCCYVTYNEGGEDKDECAYIYDSKSNMKEKINQLNSEGKSKVKIQCYSNYVGKYINIIGIITLIFFFY